MGDMLGLPPHLTPPYQVPNATLDPRSSSLSLSRLSSS
ncbi:hypothetical protein [Sporisorium scitamineum]|uniref:Uncharacterized protein n=1 Tax=Sporisorium scitamineum TaxID=49012 RepID=A0A0F7S8L9_9BASI|nr:hypothetical protein [Sporisorium scitamineum]